MKTPKFATHYENRIKSVIDCSEGEPSQTQQHAKDECDINVIMKRYETKGILPDLIKENPQYGDFSEVPDYQEACAIVQKAELQFAGLDAGLRRKFDNDPVKFLEFATNRDNLREMVQLGLAIEIKPQIDPITTDKPEAVK